MSATIDECKNLGEGIAKSIKETDYPVVIVASSDMSHMYQMGWHGKRIKWQLIKSFLWIRTVSSPS